MLVAMLVVATDAKSAAGAQDRTIAERMHLHLHLDLTSEPIVGRLVLAGGAPTAFTGYTGLIAALEALRECEQDITGAADGTGASDEGRTR
jgi:hypothetical protein